MWGDGMQAQVTIWESLMFSARLRLPPEVSIEMASSFITDVRPHRRPRDFLSNNFLRSAQSIPPPPGHHPTWPQGHFLHCFPSNNPPPVFSLVALHISQKCWLLPPPLLPLMYLTTCSGTFLAVMHVHLYACPWHPQCTWLAGSTASHPK